MRAPDTECVPASSDIVLLICSCFWSKLVLFSAVQQRGQLLVDRHYQGFCVKLLRGMGCAPASEVRGFRLPFHHSEGMIVRVD